MTESASWRTEGCRSCGASVVWATTIRGKAMPVDVAATAEGNVALSPRGELPPLATVVQNSNGDLLHTSHFATCPEAGKWRRRRG